MKDIIGIGRIDFPEGGFIGQISGNGFDGIFSFAFDDEMEQSLLPVLASDFLPVHQENDFLLVGANIDIGLGLFAVDEAFAAEMDEWSFAPEGFIKIEGIFFGFPVESNETLVVFSRIATDVSGIRGEIEHIP